MASPVHRFLFSPPTSPNLSAAASPLLDDPVGTIRELLSPSVPQGGFVNYKPSAIAAEAEVTTSSMGPGGFNSTRSYPSRYTRASSSRSANVNAYELPPIPASVKTAMPLDVPSTTSRNDSSRGQRLHRRTNSVTNDVLRLEIAQTAGLNVSSRPILSRSALKRLALFFAVLASIYLFASSSLIGGKRLSVMNNGTMTPEAIRQELVGSPAIRPSSRYVGGKKITVKSSHGAPKVIVTQKMSAAQAPPRAYRPISPTAPLTPERELLALQTYLLEDSLHTIAPSVNPSKPLDPVIMLGFAPRDENGWKELKGEADPVVVWDIGHAWTTPIYNLLAIYAILPAPRVLSLEDRSDGSIIQSILSRIVPGHVASRALITIGGSPVDGYEELLRLHQDGLLYGMLERAGAVVDGQKEAEKIEMARRSRIRPLKMGRVERR